jgi:hypothetical protein
LGPHRRQRCTKLTLARGNDPTVKPQATVHEALVSKRQDPDTLKPQTEVHEAPSHKQQEPDQRTRSVQEVRKTPAGKGAKYTRPTTTPVSKDTGSTSPRTHVTIRRQVQGHGVRFTSDLGSVGRLQHKRSRRQATTPVSRHRVNTPERT